MLMFFNNHTQSSLLVRVSAEFQSLAFYLAIDQYKTTCYEKDRSYYLFSSHWFNIQL